MGNLTFKEFEDVNIKRDIELWGHTMKWDDIHWSNAIAGEAGELCNLTKKSERDGNISEVEMAKEVADIITYCFLYLISKNISVESVVINKFNEVSDRLNCKIKI